MDRLTRLAQGRGQEQAQGLLVIVPRATEEVGRPDLPCLMKGAVAEGAGKGIVVVGSCPDSMGRAFRNTYAETVMDGWNVSITIRNSDGRLSWYGTGV